MIDKVRKAGSELRELGSSSTTRSQRVGVYLASANWEKLAYLAIVAVAAWHYVTPWLASAVVPALVHLAYQARVFGRQALVQAYLRAIQGASQEQAERWAEEELADRTEGDRDA